MTLNQIVCFLIFHVWDEPFHWFEVIEEAAGDDADDGVAGNGNEHAHDAADMTGDKQYDEDFQRTGLDARGVNERLVDEGIHQLGGQHDAEDYKSEQPDVHAQPDAGTIFQDDTEHHSDQFANQNPVT